MMTFMELSDQYFQWWQSAATRYMDLVKQEPFLLRGFGFSLERSLEFKKALDMMMDEMWRNFRLPPLEEITRLHERLNYLETRLVDLQEQDRTQELADLLKKRNLATQDDLKPVKKAISDVNKQMAGAAELKRLNEALAKMEAKVSSLAEELAGIKETVTRIDPKLESLAASWEKAAKGVSAKKG